MPDSFDTLGTLIWWVNEMGRVSGRGLEMGVASHYSPCICSEVYEQLVAGGLIVPKPEKEPPTIPMDYSWAQVRNMYTWWYLFTIVVQELGLIRKPSSFISSICDDRGEELLYAGMAISDVFKEDIGIGGVMSLLWFQRRFITHYVVIKYSLIRLLEIFICWYIYRLPDYACKFLEICLMVCADHGPAVSGAHNTIVTARAGKDLVSSLASGLLTIVSEKQ